MLAGAAGMLVGGLWWAWLSAERITGSHMAFAAVMLALVATGWLGA